MRADLVDRPIDPAALIAEVASASHGATSLFIGTVRDTNEGRAVSGLDYSAYEAMAVRELRAIVAQAASQFESARVAVEHRVGTLGLGEASVVIAVSHAHRDQALEATRFIIEELKRRVPIWKREHYADGTRQWVNAVNADAEVSS